MQDRLTGKGLYLFGGVLAIVVIATLVITAQNLTGRSHTSSSTPIPNAKTTSIAKIISQGKLTRSGSTTPTSLPTANASRFTFPYSSGGSLATHARQAVQHAATDSQAPHVTAHNGALTVTGLDTHPPGLMQNFDGINAVQDLHVNAYDNDPPDQGLCVNSSFVVEQVNSAMAIYHHDGSLVAGPFALNVFYGENPREFIADPRCYFDPLSGAWISTMVAIDSPDYQHSHLILAVNPDSDPSTAWTVYHLDTTDSGIHDCPCWPDNPRLSADRFGVYITQNEFNRTALMDYNSLIFKGSQIYAISMTQLLHLQPAPYFVHYGGMTIGGMTADALYPAFTQTQAPAEFFTSSLYRNLSTSNRLAVWALTEQDKLDSGGIPILSSILIQSEAYGRALLAIQKRSTVPIDPDDARMQDVIYQNGLIWATLNTLVNVTGEPVNRTGTAWFSIRPEVEQGQLIQARIEDQGYIAVKGEYLLYAALTVNQEGKGIAVMALVGPDYFPSVVFTTFAAKGVNRNFSPLHLVASGSEPAKIGACRPQFGGICTWGDYSAAVVDSTDGSIWLATEYIPAGAATPNENWGTRILEIEPTV